VALTNAQLQTLKADIVADGALNGLPNTPDNAFAIAAVYNQTASPDYYLWRSSITTYDIRSVLVWDEYDTLSVSKQNAFQFLCSNGIVDARLSNVRQGIASIFSGAPQQGNLTALTNLSKRLATRAEKLFVVSGSGTQGTPGVSAFVDGFQLSDRDVLTARSLP
jgi:hypothetical protein